MNRRATTMQLGPFILGLACLTPIATIHAADPAELDDPYLNLEEVTGDAALAWVREQNAASTAELAGSDAFKALEARLLAIYDSDQKIPYVKRPATTTTTSGRTSDHPRGLWRRTTLERVPQGGSRRGRRCSTSTRSARRKARTGSWHGASCLPPEYRRCLRQLSRGGADATVVREFDVDDEGVRQGRLRRCPKQERASRWRDDDTVFVGTDFGPGSLTTSGYPRIVKQWKRGTPLAAAKTVFEGRPDDVGAFALPRPHAGLRARLRPRGIDVLHDSEQYLLARRQARSRSTSPTTPSRASCSATAAAAQLRSDWSVGGKTYPRGRAAGHRLDAFLAGKRDFDVLFEPTRAQVARELRRARSDSRAARTCSTTCRAARRSDAARRRQWTREPTMPDCPALGTVGVDCGRRDDSDDVLLSPRTTSLHADHALRWASRQRRRGEAQVAAGVLRRHGTARSSSIRATSQGRHAVPYFVVIREGHRARRHATRRCSTATAASRSPHDAELQRRASGAAWLERGGVYVARQHPRRRRVRPGAGTRPALKENRQRAYEDFIAVAEDLIARKITSPQHLGIMGGSNGGLLVGRHAHAAPRALRRGRVPGAARST